MWGFGVACSIRAHYVTLLLLKLGSKNAVQNSIAFRSLDRLRVQGPHVIIAL
jgi:hypothetical protein